MNLLSVAGVLVVCTPAARASWVVCGSRRSCSPHSSWRDSLRILRMDLADWTELPDSSVGETFFTTLDGRGEDGVAPDGTFPPGEDLVEAELRRIFNVGSDETFQSTDVDELKVRLPPTHRSHAYFKGSHKELLVVGELF